MQERRADPRLAISLNALVHPPRGRSWPCVVRDFCAGGMLLLNKQGSGMTLHMTGSDPVRGDELDVHFAVPPELSSRPEGHFRLRATVARVVDDGLGVYFPAGIDPQAFESLCAVAGVEPGRARAGAASAEASPAEAPSSRLPEADAERIRELLLSTGATALPRLAKAFFERAEQELMLNAREARSNELQSRILAGLNQLDGIRPRFEKALVEAVAGPIREPRALAEVLEERRRAESGGATRKLALVDTDAFEDWLVVADVIAKAEARHEEAIDALRLRLGRVASSWNHKEAVPFGPATVTRAFDGALEGGAFEREVRALLFRVYQDAVVPQLRTLYATLNQQLEDSGVFPELEALEEEERQTAFRRARGPDAPAVADEGAQQEPQEQADAQDDAARAGVGASAAEEATGAAGGVGAGRSPVAGLAAAGAIGPARAGTGAGAGASPGRAGARNLYGTVRQLLDVGRQAGATGGEVPPAPERVFSRDEVRDALNRLQHAQPAEPGRPVRQQVAEALGAGEAAQLAPAESEALEVVDNLAASIREDELLGEVARSWMQGLEITLSKLATEEPAFLDLSGGKVHPALQLLNQLALLGQGGADGDAIDDEVRHEVERVTRKVVEDYDRDPAVFRAAVERLGPLVEKQQRTYQGNVERTVRASEGQQKLARARRAVVNEVGRRVEGLEIPDVVLQLLNPAWRNLLVHTHLRHGIGSPEWQHNVQVLERAIAMLRAPAEKLSERDRNALLQDVEAGLETIAFAPGQRGPLIEALERAVVAGDAPERRGVRVEPRRTAELLGLEGVVPDADPAPTVADEAEQATWRQCLKRARRMKVGDWLAMGDEAGRPRILTVAWIGEEHSRFVLVDRRGVKGAELTLRDMTDRLHQGAITVLDEFELPLVERASHRMLQNMHNRLAYQASHDELTGLINRKEFEKQLQEALRAARAGESSFVVLYMDLDQFKIINNTCGHAAGDNLLNLLAPKIKHVLRGRRSTLARMGGDEFGILLEDCDLEEGVRLADEELKAIRGYRFSWQGRQFTLSASIGVVLADAGTRRVSEILKQADAAVYAAKDGGRNRAHVFERDDSALRRQHGRMQWISAIDKALDENRLVLNCQRIAPVHPERQEPPHYEILLSMMDEEGKLLPPGEFIIAAEAYNRMLAIDRWVIRNFFHWMSLNPQKVAEAGFFSINVSGVSLNDESFLDFVLRQFSRTRVQTSKVCFEITETSAIANIDNAIDFMNKMKIIGCRFSLDDFGTGMASYSYLRNLPVDFLKIDGVFVRDMTRNPGDLAVVRSINEIAHFMGKKTIAEFVEDNEVLAKIREMGVDYAQGFGIEKPRLLDEAAAA